MAMRPVTVRILHLEPGSMAGPIQLWVSTGRADLAERHRVAFLGAGATDVEILSGPPDDLSFGARLRAVVRSDVRTDHPNGLVILGSGAMPLARAVDYQELVAAAGSDERLALANNRFSADVVAMARADLLPAIPDLPGDNALPRWLAEVAGYAVTDLRRRWRLAVDIDGPLDILLTGGRLRPAHGRHAASAIDLKPVTERLRAIHRVAHDPRAELVVAGRTSAATLAWLERHTSSRTRALVEERGLRSATRLAQSGIAETARRPPVSVIGALLDRDGPGSIGHHLARLGNAAIVDSRVLLAHRFGADEARWPATGDRFASDLLLADRVDDPWLRALTSSAATAPIPILLGGHTLVGPGMRLALGRRWS